jgi:hypothetical protein
MHKLQNGSQVTIRPARKPQVGTGGYFAESNDSGAPSYPGQDWFNDCTDEFLNALNAMGIAYDPLKVDHLARALSSVNPVWNTSTDFIIGMRSVQSGQQYVAVQPSGPNNGGAVNPSTDTDWSHWKPVWALNQVENRLKGNQNWNIPGRAGHPLPDATPRDYPSGAEIALGYFVGLGQEVINFAKDNEVLSADGGYYYVDLIADVNSFFGIKLPDNRVFKATIGPASTHGVGVAQRPDGVTARVSINFTKLIELGIPRGAHKFVGCSELPGIWPDVSDEESIFADYNKLLLSRVKRDVTASRQSSPMTYTNNSPVEMRLLITIQGSWPGSRTLNIGAESYSLFINSTIQTYMQFDEIIKPGETYSFTGTFTQWIEESL